MIAKELGRPTIHDNTTCELLMPEIYNDTNLYTDYERINMY